MREIEKKFEMFSFHFELSSNWMDDLKISRQETTNIWKETVKRTGKCGKWFYHIYITITIT